tara:strand:- start:531 stop:677 length:147 start_codon:yes stop_codon:yes gene_type:complete
MAFVKNVKKKIKVLYNIEILEMKMSINKTYWVSTPSILINYTYTYKEN